jgi:hypothetical protein
LDFPKGQERHGDDETPTDPVTLLYVAARQFRQTVALVGENGETIAYFPAGQILHVVPFTCRKKKKTKLDSEWCGVDWTKKRVCFYLVDKLLPSHLTQSNVGRQCKQHTLIRLAQKNCNRIPP